MGNKLYTATETTIIFVDPAVASGNNYVSFVPADLPNNSGWVSDPRDFGEFPNPTLFRWRAKSMCGSPPTINRSVELYWMGFDNPAELSAATGVLFGADANFTSGNQLTGDGNRRKNLQWLGSVTADRAESGVAFTSSGLCHLYGRYGSLVVYNFMGESLSTATDATAFSLTPVPEEMQ